MNSYGKVRKIQLSNLFYQMIIEMRGKNDQYRYLYKSLTNKIDIKIIGKQ